MVDNDWTQSLGSRSSFQADTHYDFAIQKIPESLGLDTQTQIHMNGSDSNEIFYSSIDDDLSNEEQWFRYPTPFRVVENIDHFEDISSMFSEKDVKDLISNSVLSSPSIRKQEDYHTSVISSNSNGEEYHTKNDVGTRAEKRLRKPTRRYIDEMPEPSSKLIRRKGENSIPKSSVKIPPIKRHKLLDVKSRDQKSLPEELTGKAIQVPFGPIVCCESQKKPVPVATMVKIELQRHQVAKPKLKGNQASSSSKLQVNQVLVPGNQASSSSKLKINQADGLPNEQVFDSSSESLTFVVKTTSQDDHIGVMKSGDSCGRRKHHIQWTISEVMKLIDGVSQHGVGRWSRIKKDLFPSSTHRTPVDLKDKWRNLLKATNMQRENKGGEDKKRNMAWRPLPKSILQHVSELAIAYPYPRDLQSKP